MLWVAVLVASVVVGTILLHGHSKRRQMSSSQMADLIERFLDGKSRYPQEWNEFVDSSQRDKKMDLLRKRCYELDPLINRPDAPDAEAVAEARTIVNELRNTH
jgi:hypothetical protein